MDHSTPQSTRRNAAQRRSGQQRAGQERASKRHTQRYHADPEFDQVLAVFFEQGNEQLAPSFLAYELDLTTNAAEGLLDEMVKRSLLDLDFDDNGTLYYSLSADVLFEMQQHETSAEDPSQDGWSPSNDWAGSQHGFDGAIGHDSSTSAAPSPHQPHHRRPAYPVPTGPDGCDGTVGHPGDHPRMAASRGGPQGSRRRGDAGRNDGRRNNADRNDANPNDASQKLRRGGASVQLVRHRQSDNLPARRRNAEPMVAALLSVLLVGTGQIYNRDVGKGIAFFVVYAVLLTTFFPVGWMVNVWAAIDAYSSARRRNAEAKRTSPRLTD